MSFRGFQKSVARAPQQFKAKFNLGEQSKDPVYVDAERRFSEVERETKKLHDESKRYADAINGMLTHQIEFSKAMTEVYNPISGSVSDPDSLIPEGNAAGIRACEEYEAVVKEMQETLAPELEMIESRVVQPANELLGVIQVIRKTAIKREHKKLDFDRHTAALKKIQDKKEKTLKDEKAMYKAESDLEQSTQDFEYFNDLLKDELPKLFRLEREFIQPLFQSFYYMQLNIFYTLHERMQQCDIGYFDLTLDVEEAFEKKRGDIQERVEKLRIVKFRTSGGKRPPAHSKYGRPALEGGRKPLAITAGPSSSGGRDDYDGRDERDERDERDDRDRRDHRDYRSDDRDDHNDRDDYYNDRKNRHDFDDRGDRNDYDDRRNRNDYDDRRNRNDYDDRRSRNDYDDRKNRNDYDEDGAEPPSYGRFHQQSDSESRPPPPYSVTASAASATSPQLQGGGSKFGGGGASSSLAAAAAAKSKPPPPKPKPSRFSAQPPPRETVTALYDYAAAQEGDLGFNAGDVIEVVTRTDNANEWWEGRLNGRQGQFPGNYVQLNS